MGLRGRKEIPIDWIRVDELLEAGCLGTEIAPHFGMHHDTLYDRVEEKYGVKFAVYASYMRGRGESILREKQYLKALGKEKTGDTTLLMWLGKNRLKQCETPPQELTELSAKNHEELMAQMQAIREQSATKDSHDQLLNKDFSSSKIDSKS